MEIQKLTILDIARAAREIDRFSGAKIIGCRADDSRSFLYLSLSGQKAILKYAAAKKLAYIGLADVIPSGTTEVFPSLDAYRLAGCEQCARDRILRIDLEKKDRLGRSKKMSLIFEVLPNRGNVYLLGGDGALKGNLKNRGIKVYSSPRPLKKMTIFDFDERALRRLIDAGSDLSKEIMGLSRRDLNNIGERFKLGPENAGGILSNYVNKAVEPGPAWIIYLEDKAAGFSLIEPNLSDGETAKKFDSALRMCEDYYSGFESFEYADGGLRALLKILDSHIAKTSKRLSAIEIELDNAEKAEEYRILGELILANISEIEKGRKSVNLRSLGPGSDKYYNIELDPSKSPSANAADYFKKYKKAISSISKLRRRLAEARRSVADLEKIRREESGDVVTLRERIIELGLIPPERKPSTRKQPPPRKPYRLFKASCGWDILVGKSNADNDELSLKIASKEDYWFHAWQAAGSHVVLRLPNKKAVPDKQTLLEAASLAAYYSKARGSSKVPVIYTQAKYVRKPRKFAPGKVIVEREKQLMVRPAGPKEFAAAEE